MTAKMGEMPLDLNIRLGRTDGEPDQRASGQVRGVEERGDGLVPGWSVNHQWAGSVQTRPALLFAAALQSLCGPGAGMEGFDFGGRLGTERGAEDKEVAAAAQATQGPERRDIPGLEHQDQLRGAERGLGLLDFELHGGGAQPAQRSFFSHLGKSLLQPQKRGVAFANVGLGSDGKPAHHQEDNNYEESQIGRHGSAARRRWKARGLYDRGKGAGQCAERGAEAGTWGSNPVSGGRMRAVREFLYGLIGYEFERQALEMRGELESAFLLITMGDMLGVPIIPPLYSLRLLPFVTPQIASWKRRVMRERELSDKEEFHLHGV